MNIIAAVDRNWAIGFKGKTLVDIPADRKLFREETMGKVVVMGRKTLDSLPGGQPLPGRVNIVLSRGEGDLGKGGIRRKGLRNVPNIPRRMCMSLAARKFMRHSFLTARWPT